MTDEVQVRRYQLVQQTVRYLVISYTQILTILTTFRA